MNSAPRSTTAPSPNGTDHTRPPTRSRASSTVTSAPPALRASAAARPANPAPMTQTRSPFTTGILSARAFRFSLGPSQMTVRGRMPPPILFAVEEDERVLEDVRSQLAERYGGAY